MTHNGEYSVCVVDGRAGEFNTRMQAVQIEPA